MAKSAKRACLVGRFIGLLVFALRTDAQPAPVPLVGPAATAVGCLIQTDFFAGGKRNFELVALEGSSAIHYWRANDATITPWRKGEVISVHAAAPGCIVQSDFMSGGHGNLEAVIPEVGGALVHYWRDSGNVLSGWNRTGAVTTGVTGGACFITSDYLTAGHANFEVMAQKGDQLWHYWHTAGAPFDNWPGELVTTGVTGLGPGCLIQSDYLAGGHRNLEVVVQKGSELWHHWHWLGMAAGAWPGAAIVSGVTAPGCLIASDYKANNIRNFEVMVEKGSALWHHWRWDGMAAGLWPGAPIISPVTGAGCLLQSDFTTTGSNHANFEVVVPSAVQVSGQGNVNEVVHYFQAQQAGPSPWQRGQTVTYQGRSEKVCQLTSDYDWATGVPTTTRTQTLAGLGGVDLGYPVEHQGRLMLLFGDAWPTQVAPIGDEFQPKDDAVGWINTRTPPTPAQCTDMVVNSVPRRPPRPPLLPAPPPPPPQYAPATITGPLQVAQGYFNVPSGGVSDGAGVTAFFWTNHCHSPNAVDPNPLSPLARPAATGGCAETDQLNSLGLGVMARSSDGGRTFNNAVLLPNGFTYTTALDSNAVDGMPANQRLGTYIFAVPRYRASVPYLAYAPPGTLGDPTSWRLFAGRRNDGSPVWLSEEVWQRGSGGPWRPPGSPELFDTDTCIGEFSITWNKPLSSWLMLYNCGDSHILARTASKPWGPWSASAEILSLDRDGVSCLLVMTPQGCGGQQRYWDVNTTGHFYAPYVLDRYTTPLTNSTGSSAIRARIYWVVSSWYPYQVSIMRTDLELSK